MPGRAGMLVLASTLAAGGGERVLAGLLLELSRRGLPVALLCLKEPGQVGEELAAAGIPTAGLGLRSTRHPRVLLALLRRIRRDGPTLLYLQDHHDCLFWGRLAAALAGFVPAVSPVHSSSLGALRAFRGYNRLVLGLSPNLVTLGAWQEAALAEREGLARGLWARIPNPVAAAAAPRRGQRAKGGRIVLGSVAALRPEKRQDLMLELTALLAGEFDVELRLIGDGPLRGELEAGASALGLGDRVRFYGYRDDVAALLPELDLFLLTSGEEAMPVSVIEAMRAGVPVAATPRGGVPELLGHGRRGLLLSGEEPAAWAVQVAGLLRNPPGADELDAWAEVVERRHDFARFADDYVRLLAGLGLAP